VAIIMAAAGHNAAQPVPVVVDIQVYSSLAQEVRQMLY
jgi:hypothetical protein